jgi:hypothetical protein
MKKVKILKVYSSGFSYNDYNSLINNYDLESASEWTEVTDEEYKVLTNPACLKHGSYIVIEEQSKEDTLLSVKKIAEELYKKELDARAKQAAADRQRRLTEEKRKAALAAKKEAAAARKIEKARMILQQAGEL